MILVMSRALAYAAFDKTAPFGPFNVDRREPGPRDVQIDILFCGVCHSDLHTARSEWPGTIYPCVPGHEIAGRVASVGSAVTGFKAGALAAVGCMVDSCMACASCLAGLQRYLRQRRNHVHLQRARQEAAGRDHLRRLLQPDRRRRAVLPAPAGDARPCRRRAAPLRWDHDILAVEALGRRQGKKVGIVGLGGLGHMGVKLSHAFGAHTVLFTTSPGKTEDARRLGADQAVVSKDAVAMQEHAASFDLILNTVAASHDLDAYTALLKRDGTMVLLGVPEQPHPSPEVGNLIFKRRRIAGSLIGGIPETQEMLDFCATHDIVCDIELIPIQKIDDAYERMRRGNVKYRFVIDMASLK